MASSTARRLLLSTTGGVAGYATYKSKYDPPHLVWDLDSTLLYSVSPLPSTHSTRLESFDQIDDDFPLEGSSPNTRTYWRPGARTALQIFRFFAIQHVFTAAQATYTENILERMDRSLFDTVLHRDTVPQPKGKDLEEILNRASTSSSIGLNRCILFDDRVRNFRPQNGENGIHVVPYEVKKNSGPWEEYREMARWMGIAVLALLAPDVRSVLPYFRSGDHKKLFTKEKKDPVE